MSKRNKGIHIKFRKDRKCWDVQEFIAGKRKRHATGYANLEDAETKLIELLAKTTKIRERPSIGQIIIYYANEHIPTLARPDIAINNLERITPFWSSLHLEDIAQSTSLEYYEFRNKEYREWQENQRRNWIKDLKHASVRRELEQLQAAISFAYKHGKIHVNPFIYKFEKGKSKTRWLTRSEAAALIRAARTSEQSRDYLVMFILIGIYTGARMTAILRLRWVDVDLDNGIIDFTVNDTSNKKKGAITRIPRRLLRLMRAHRKYGVSMGYVIHNNQAPLLGLKKSYKTACTRAGLSDVTIHTLRHTCASWLIQGNVSTDKIAKHLGHTSPRMIEQTYGHLAPDHLDEVMDAFG